MTRLGFAVMGQRYGFGCCLGGYLVACSPGFGVLWLTVALVCTMGA